ncbi:Rossmann-fold NAD(P)-binding domain-containing protein [Tabrizicola caldifontis]|uniref:hypothetical protein n=1 Tax=Tabrizicola caldifontis TaxID=2528036 RepID=UPI001080A796|nr:hypothetical protein [Rhodobacter sp. YIM 73028]
MATACEKSKTPAEHKAWEIAKERGLNLTVISPGFIPGPPPDRHHGSSLGLVERFLKGRGAMVPPMGLAIVDLREAPKPVLRQLSLLDEDIRTILPRLGLTDSLQNTRAALELGTQLISPQAAPIAAAEWLVSHATARG